MADANSKENISKVYCEKCDVVFDSKAEYEKHYDKHNGIVVCESCPLDTAVSKILSLFRKKN